MKFDQFHREYGNFNASLPCENELRIQESKIFDFLDQFNHNPTQKSAILSMKKMLKMAVFPILPFS